MNIKQVKMVEELMQYAERVDFFNLTSSELAVLRRDVANALDKQIPMEYISYQLNTYYGCPNCGSKFELVCNCFCKECGQQLLI